MSAIVRGKKRTHDVAEKDPNDEELLANEEEETASDSASDESSQSEDEDDSMNSASDEENDEEISNEDDTDSDSDDGSSSSSESDEEELNEDDLTSSGSEELEVTEESKTTDKNANEPQELQNQQGQSAPAYNEYEVDSSDEEDIRNTVGNIPMEWYKEYEHIGYDLLGRKIGKAKSGDQLDEFLRRMEDPNYWRTVKDRSTGENVVLNDEDVDFIQRFQSGKYVDANYDPYEPWIDWFSTEVMQHPLRNMPEHKRSFIPSLSEKQKVGRMVHAIKMGWIKPKPPKDKSKKYFALWDQDEKDNILKKHRQYIPAPKLPLPGHAESYNPPPEYLPTKEEEEKWLARDPEDTKLPNFLPKKFNSLRQVPSYRQLLNERFQRCLDLYLCPRKQRVRTHVEPEELLPKLPKPSDLQPFPTTMSLVYKGHEGIVRTITVDPTGQWLASGSDDGTVRVWEISTGRCMRAVLLGTGAVRSISWNPNPNLSLVAVAFERQLLLLVPGVGDKLITSNTENLLDAGTVKGGEEEESKAYRWTTTEQTDREQGVRLRVEHGKVITQVTWHGRGDYVAVVMPDGGNHSVVVHQVSKRRSQYPFKKTKGAVQKVAFHPIRPIMFIASQRHVRVYNLVEHKLVKKLTPSNMQWISSLSVHPGGDNCIVGSYDCRLSWFDLDLSRRPYQTLRHHTKAIRQVTFHKKYPLFASASDDGSVIICHGMVYSDWLQNALIVPVKILRGHGVVNNLGVLDCHFHPTQPWIFSSGADKMIRLFT